MNKILTYGEWYDEYADAIYAELEENGDTREMDFCFKRDMSIRYQQYLNGVDIWVDQVKIERIKNDPTRHYPNKNEGKTLRRLMSENSMTEEEVRGVKKFRKILADARIEDQKTNKGRIVRYYKGLIKEACKETGLVPQHPKTLEVIQRKIDDRGYNYPRYMMWYTRPLTHAKTIVKYYSN